MFVYLQLKFAKQRLHPFIVKTVEVRIFELFKYFFIFLYFMLILLLFKFSWDIVDLHVCMYVMYLDMCVYMCVVCMYVCIFVNAYV